MVQVVIFGNFRHWVRRASVQGYECFVLKKTAAVIQAINEGFRAMLKNAIS